MRGVFSKFSLGVGLATSVLGNIWDFTAGSQRETGVLSREFAVSTGVDFALAAGVGLASAGIVAGVALLAGATLTLSAGILIRKAVISSLSQEVIARRW